jgi:hypothetical protein
MFRAIAVLLDYRKVLPNLLLAMLQGRIDHKLWSLCAAGIDCLGKLECEAAILC